MDINILLDRFAQQIADKVLENLDVAKVAPVKAESKPEKADAHAELPEETPEPEEKPAEQAPKTETAAEETVKEKATRLLTQLLAEQGGHKKAREALNSAGAASISSCDEKKLPAVVEALQNALQES